MNEMKLAVEVVNKYREELMEMYHQSIASKELAEKECNQQWLENAEYNADNALTKATGCREVIKRLEEAMVVVDYLAKEKQENE